MDLSHHTALRVGILSDTHAYLDPRVAALVNGCDLAIHAGDICTGEVLDTLKPRLGTVVAVTGNNDRAETWPPHQEAVVTALPKSVRVRLPGGDLAVEHGHAHGMTTPCHDSLRRSHPEARAIVYGHTHKQLFDDDSEPWVLNPGAAGRTRTHGGPSCIVLTARTGSWSVDLRRFPTEPA